MKQIAILVSFTALISCISAIDLHIAAIDPQSSGQIGINYVTPVTNIVTETDVISIDTQATGDPKANIGSIGVNTEFLTEDGGTTKWIGMNTAYLTELVQTATASGAATTITNVPSMQIVGAVDDNGLPTGAFDFVITPMLLSQIQDLANALCADQTTCSTEFPPRVEALLKAGGDILTKRGGEAAVVGLFAAITMIPQVQDFIVHVVTAYWQMAFGKEPIPHVIHIDVPKDGAPSPTKVLPTTFVMTVVAMPTIGIGSSGGNLNGNGNDDETCWKYVGVDIEPIDSDAIGEATDSSDEDDTLDKRSIAGRILLDRKSSLLLPGLSKRAGDLVYINQIGRCAATPTPNVIVRAEIHPGPQVVMKPFNLQATGDESGLDPNMYWYVPAQNAGDVNNPCVVAKLTKKGKRDPSNPSTRKRNFPLPYDQSETAKTLTVEHIFETSTLQDFFSSVFQDPNDPRCETFVKMFDKPDNGLQGGEKPRFYTLWSQQSNPLPDNWAFAGVDARINNFKGTLLNPNLGGYPNLRNIVGPNADQHFDRLFQTWNNAGLSMDFINNPDVATYFSQRNAKVYAAFRDFDTIQACEKDPADKTPSTSWAEEFKKYMTNLLITNQGLIQAKITDLNARISAEDARLKKASGELNKYGKAFVSLQENYPASHFVFATEALLKFPEEELGIRDVTPTDTCTKPTPSAACVVRTIVDCLYQYQDRPDLSLADCPPIPTLPESCGGSQPTPTPTPSPSLQPPALSSQGCYDRETHEDVVGAQVKADAVDICNKIDNNGAKVTMDANTVAKVYNPSSWYLSVNNYWYGVGWIVGCQTTSATQVVVDPLGDGNKDHSCATLLSKNWDNCNNGGTGGWIDAGCLRYTFKASPNKLTTNWNQVVKTS